MTSEKLFIEMVDDFDDVPMGLLRHAARKRREAAKQAKPTLMHGYNPAIGEFAIAVGQ